MYNQYVCHTDGMPLYKMSKGRSAWERIDYHLDPWRPNIGYWGFVNRRCNSEQFIKY